MSPGTLPWLVGHEVRLFRRQFAGRNARGRLVAFAILGVLLLVLSVVLARGAGAPVGDPALLLLLDIGLLLVALLMVSQGLIQAVKSLYERGDLELLLPSPIAPRTILAAKLTGVAATILLAFLPFAALFVVPLAVFGGVRWLGALGVLAALAVGAAGLGALLARGLFLLFGPRRARVAAQVLAAAIGAGFFLVGQAAQFVPDGALRRLRAVDFADHLLGRAATGDPARLALLAVAAAAGFALVVGLLGERFVADAARAPGAVRRRRAGAARFTAGAAAALVRKELLLLRRDTELLFPIVLRALYMLPVFAPFVAGGGVSPSLAASAATLVASQLAGSFAWVTLCAEAAPDLVAAAPAQTKSVRRAKLAAALLPVYALALVPAAIVGRAVPLAGVATLVGVGCGAMSAGLLQYWYGRPQKREAFRTARNASILLGIADVALSLLWAWTAALLAQGSPWALAPAGLAVAALFADTERQR